MSKIPSPEDFLSEEIDPYDLSEEDFGADIWEIVYECAQKSASYGVFIRPKAHPNGAGVILLVIDFITRKSFHSRLRAIVRQHPETGPTDHWLTLDEESPVSMILDWMKLHQRVWYADTVRYRHTSLEKRVTFDIIAARGEAASTLLSEVCKRSKPFIRFDKVPNEEFNFPCK